MTQNLPKLTKLTKIVRIQSTSMDQSRPRLSQLVKNNQKWPKIDEVDQDSENYILNFICHTTKNSSLTQTWMPLMHNLNLSLSLSLSLTHAHTHIHTHTHTHTNTDTHNLWMMMIVIIMIMMMVMNGNGEW